MVKRASVIIGVLLFGSVGVVIGQSEAPTIEVHKSATCGCCSKWVAHLQANGLKVRTINDEDLTEFKAKHRVPERLQSCHTAIVNGYVLEGHVPASDVRRLLKERPAIVGLAVPGMPVGSPGMEIPNVKVQPFDVLAFDQKGQTRVFASHVR